MSRYLLSADVYVCITEDAAIFLDLRRDEYLGLDQSQMSALTGLVRGWPNGLSGLTDTENEAPSHERLALVERLLRRGLLTQQDRIGKPATPILLEHIEDSLVDRSITQMPRVGTSHVFRLLTAWLRSLFMLRFSPLCHVISRVQIRKNKHAPKSLSEAELSDARELTSIFCFLRRFLYTPKNRCLFDSLVLVEFLAQYKVYPTWVFGVKTNPFGAHSWVQQGHYVLNGPPEFVRKYNPIVSA